MDIGSAAAGVVGLTVVREVFKRATSASYGGKVALITGAGTGIGREMALILAADGCSLVLWGRREGPLKAVAEEAQAVAKKAGRKKPLQIRIDTVDVSVQPSVAATAAAVLDEFELAVMNASSRTSNPVMTKAYTGLETVGCDESAGTCTLVVSYDRLANGNAGPDPGPGPHGAVDAAFTMRVTVRAI